MTVFNTLPTNHLKAKMFFDPNGPVNIARYDTLKYPELDFLTEKQIGQHWGPREVDLNKDRTDFQKLTPFGQHIFTSNLKRQILLDSVQGRSPSQAFGPITSSPELEVWLKTWEFFETIHSRTYTWIIRGIYPNPSLTFDGVMQTQEILDCARDVSKYYDTFIKQSNWYQMFGPGVKCLTDETGYVHAYGAENMYELKKSLYRCLMSVNILEGIRFYVSFACSWAFAEQVGAPMEGNAKLIGFICRDENLHLASTQKLLRTILPEDDEDFAKIRQEMIPETLAMFREAMDQEKEWAKYLFKDGSIIGLNETLLCDYVDYMGSERIKALGFKPDFDAPKRDPLPWTGHWISNKGTQEAPQETEKGAYLIGGVKQDVAESDFANFVL
jgi:ribonucleoside-diphosphate reductase beta chain